MWQLSARGLDTARPNWIAGQTTLPAVSAFSIVLEGEASNGGFAVDDVRVRPGSCQSKFQFPCTLHPCRALDQDSFKILFESFSIFSASIWRVSVNTISLNAVGAYPPSSDMTISEYSSTPQGHFQTEHNLHKNNNRESKL